MNIAPIVRSAIFATQPFRLLNRHLTQMKRILEINALNEVTKAVVVTHNGVEAER